MSDPHPSNHFTQYAMGKDMGTSLESLSLRQGVVLFSCQPDITLSKLRGLDLNQRPRGLVLNAGLARRFLLVATLEFVTYELT